jgi:hypothetical protein
LNPDFLLLANLAATLFLTGLAWCLQIVHLPLFEKVGKLDFAFYAASHRRRNSLLMSLPMLVEAASAGWLWWDTPAGPLRGRLFLALGLVLLIWIITFAIQIPQHAKLLGGYDEDVIARLRLWNWLRTLAWSARSAIMLWIIADRLHI